MTFAYHEALSDILAHAKRFEGALTEAQSAINIGAEVFGADSDDARRAHALARAAYQGLGDLPSARAANERLRGLPEHDPKLDLPAGAAPPPS